MKILESKRLPLLLSIASGLLLALPWYESFSGLILLFAFTPILYAEHLLSEKNARTRTVIMYAALAMAIWAGIDTWWIKNAATAGMIAAIIIHATFGSLVFALFHITKKRLGQTPGYISLIFFWIAFEYFYTNAEISFPWLTFGNGFAKDTFFIQWYEYTGIFGGSLWALLVNVVLFSTIISIIDRRKRHAYKMTIVTLCIVLLPIITSTIIYYNVVETGKKVNVVLLQPNIDPYHEKFDGLSSEEQTAILLNLAAEAVDSSTKLILGPETALQGRIMEESLELAPSIAMVKQFMEQHPNASMIVGMTSMKTYDTPYKPTPTARKYSDANQFYDRYNAALQINTSGFRVYHKSLLVVGVEKMPYLEYLPFIEELAVNLGGTIGSLGTQEERTVFQSSNDSIRVAPAICYESVYGEYYSGWVRNGANVGAIITNDGWWGDTPGYRQHLSYSSLRAIETRRYIARSANTGISAIINLKGEVVKRLGWWQRGYIKGEVVTNDKITFYAVWGDYIGRIATLLTLLMLPILLVKFLKRKGQ